MGSLRQRTRGETRANGNGHQPQDASPWTEAFHGGGEGTRQGANGRHAERPAYPLNGEDTAVREALMQCYNG